jgi:hypothetical protein
MEGYFSTGQSPQRAVVPVEEEEEEEEWHREGIPVYASFSSEFFAPPNVCMHFPHRRTSYAFIPHPQH